MDERFREIAQQLEQRSPVNIDGTLFTVSITSIREIQTHAHVEDRVRVHVLAESPTGQWHPYGVFETSAKHLAEPDYIADQAIQTVMQIVRGQFPPGARRSL